jgi:hypothetical protein
MQIGHQVVIRGHRKWSLVYSSQRFRSTKRLTFLRCCCRRQDDEEINGLKQQACRGDTMRQTCEATLTLTHTNYLPKRCSVGR